MKKMFHVVLLLCIAMMLASCGTTNHSANSPTDDNSAPSLTPSKTTAQSKTTPAPKKTLTFGSSFEFDDLEITFGSDISFVQINNRFSDQNGADVIQVPIKIKNLSAETHGLNMFYYTMYGSKGTKLSTVSTYFDNNISSAGKMRPGAQQEAYIHMLYDGDGDYFIEFNNYTTKLEVKLPITKS